MIELLPTIPLTLGLVYCLAWIRRMAAFEKLEGEEGFAFCELFEAKNRLPWHIRRLTSAEQKALAVTDSESLCGELKVGDGRDVSCDFKHHLGVYHLRHTSCRKCRAVYLRDQRSKQRR